MNVRIVVAMLGLACAWTTSFAENGILDSRLLITTGQYLGPGARAQGLGGTYTGIADDYSAVWWNPAGLAQIKRMEMHGSLSRTGYANDANYLGSSVRDETNELRLNGAGFVFPVPVYQGALTFAVGYSQTTSFDKRRRYGLAGSDYWQDFDLLESGRLGFWSLASAMDVSPNLALGLGLQYWRGIDDYSFIGDSAGGAHYEESIGTKLGAWGANLGALYRAGQIARIGAMFQTPMSMKVDEDYEFDGNTGFMDYRMTYPAVFRLGASIAPGRWLVAADIEYRDWTSMAFRGETPYKYYDSIDSVYRRVSDEMANREIKDQYQSTTRLSFGGEYLFPFYGLRGRGGLSFAPSNYRDAGGDDDKTILTLGVGILVDRSVMLDATYHFSSYTEKVTTGLTEDIKSNAALFTLSYRL